MKTAPPSSQGFTLAQLASALCYLVLASSVVVFLSSSSCYYSSCYDDDDDDHHSSTSHYDDDDDYCDDDDDDDDDDSGSGNNSPGSGSSGLAFAEPVTLGGARGAGSADEDAEAPLVELDADSAIFLAQHPLRLTEFQVVEARADEPFGVKALGDVSGASIRNILGDGLFGEDHFAWYADQLLAANRDLLGWPAGVGAAPGDVSFLPESVEIRIAVTGPSGSFETDVILDLLGDLTEIVNRTAE